MRERMQSGQLSFQRGLRVTRLIAFGAMLFVATAAAADPPKSLVASEVTGCCVCRGTAGSEPNTIRSCSDGAKVESCISQCRSQNAASIVFGRNQTCSQGCVGFPTQNLH